MAEGKLYIVATPLGNLEDVTFRAVRILSEVDGIACEDSRRTVKLLNRYEIKTPLITYQEYNKEQAGEKIIARLKRGQRIALVSDAGTPGISDPGFNLIRDCIREGVEVEVIPGPSAIISALVLSGLPTDRFAFEGFLPSKRERRREKLRELSSEERTLVFYESPHRIRETLEDMREILPGRPLALVREMTKIHEEVLRGTVEEVCEEISSRESLHGEITLVVGGRKEREVTAGNLDEIVEREIAGFDGSPSDLARKISELTGIPRKKIYSRILEAKKRLSPED